MKLRKKNPNTVCRWCRGPLRSGEREHDCPMMPAYFILEKTLKRRATRQELGRIAV